MAKIPGAPLAFVNVKKRRGPGVPFGKGASPGPGRPRGSRSKLSEAFLAAIHQDFTVHGAAAIAVARDADPLGYVRMVAGLMPTKTEVATDVCEMTDEDLLVLVRSSDGLVPH